MAATERAKDKGAIILVGNYRPTLPVARSLSEAGYRVVLTMDGFSAARRSRFVDEIWRPRTNHAKTSSFLEELQSYCQSRGDVSGVFPISQGATTSLLSRRDKISVPLITATPEAVLTCVDKVKTSKIASELAVPMAQFVAGEANEDLIAQANNIGYPCIAKRNDGLEHALKAVVFRSERELRDLLERWPDWFGNIMFQQYAWGPRYNRYFIAHGGRILRYVDVKILRTDRIDDTGLAVTGISVAPVQELDGHCDRMIERLAFTGAGCVQFLIDERRRSISFLEINARIPGNYAFAHYCGLDQACAMVDLRQDGRLAEWSADFSYPVGKRFAWLLGDLYGLVQGMELRHVTGSQAVKWLGRALVSSLTADNHIIWSRDDPRPALYMTRRALWGLPPRAVVQGARIILKRAKATVSPTAKGSG